MAGRKCEGKFGIIHGMAKKVKTGKKVVLVGTYKGDQLTRWRGWYNWPVSEDDFNAETQKGREGGRVSSRAAAIGACRRDGRNGRARSPSAPQSPADFSQVNELWLFQGTKDQLLKDYSLADGSVDWEKLIKMNSGKSF